MAFLAGLGLKLVSNSEARHGAPEDKPYGPDLPVKTTKTIVDPVSFSSGAAEQIDLVSAFESVETDVYTFINGKQHDFDELVMDDDGDYKLMPTFKCAQVHVSSGLWSLVKQSTLSLVALRVMASPNSSKIVVPKSLFDLSDFLLEGVNYSLLKNGRLQRLSDNDWKGTSIQVHTEILNFVFEPK